MKIEKWRRKMLAVIDTKKRESLLREIIGTLDQWPEIERSVFSQAHYQGQSVEDISRSLQLNAEEIRQILKRCDQRLHATLRDLRKTDCSTPLLPSAKTARPAA